jgi:hypothetical protein
LSREILHGQQQLPAGLEILLTTLRLTQNGQKTVLRDVLRQLRSANQSVKKPVDFFVMIIECLFRRHMTLYLVLPRERAKDTAVIGTVTQRMRSHRDRSGLYGRNSHSPRSAGVAQPIRSLASSSSPERWQSPAISFLDSLKGRRVLRFEVGVEFLLGGVHEFRSVCGQADRFPKTIQPRGQLTNLKRRYRKLRPGRYSAATLSRR